MQPFLEQYRIYKKNNSQKTIRFLAFSDIHYGIISQITNGEKGLDFFKFLIDNYKNKVDFILIPGDLLFYLNNFKDTKYFQKLKYDLNYLINGLKVPAYASLGNHDLPLRKDSSLDLNLASQLDDRQNGLFILDNEQIIHDDVCITGFSPQRDAYNTNAMPHPALEMAYDEFMNQHFIFPQDKINILCSHENKFFSYPEASKNYPGLYKDLTLILGGHLHDGYVPLWFQKKYLENLKDKGIWEKIPPQIDMCRGGYIVSEGNLSSVYVNNSSQPVEMELQSYEAASIVLRPVAKYSWFIPAKKSYSYIEIENPPKLVRTSR